MKDKNSLTDIAIIIILLWVLGGAALFEFLANFFVFVCIASVAILAVGVPCVLISSKFGKKAREDKIVKKTRLIRNKFPKELRKKYPTIENAWADFVSRYTVHFGLNKNIKKTKTRFYKHYFKKIQKVAEVA